MTTTLGRAGSTGLRLGAFRGMDHFDLWLVFPALVLVGLGLVLIDSGSSQWYDGPFLSFSNPVAKQAVFAVIGIVALARKLLIALWRFVETGLVPEGAIVTTAIRLP